MVAAIMTPLTVWGLKSHKPITYSKVAAVLTTEDGVCHCHLILLLSSLKTTWRNTFSGFCLKECTQGAPWSSPRLNPTSSTTLAFSGFTGTKALPLKQAAQTWAQILTLPHKLCNLREVNWPLWTAVFVCEKKMTILNSQEQYED